MATACRTDEASPELLRVLDELVASLPGEVTSAARLTNPLLDLWDVAHRVDAEVARPVEDLLSRLAGRHLVCTMEVEEVAGAVRSAFRTFSRRQLN